MKRKKKVVDKEIIINGDTIVWGYGRGKKSKQFNNNKMKKQIKKDNTLFNVIFLLCGAILILGLLTVITNSQLNKIIGKLEVENYNLFATNRHAENVDKNYAGKIEMLEIENEILGISNEILTEDATFLSYIARDILINYGVDLENQVEEFESILIDLFNYARLFMPYDKATDFSDDIKELQADYIEFQNSYDDEFEMFTPSDLIKY